MDWAVLGSLSDDDRRVVLASARRRRFASGEVVFHEGDKGDSVHLLAKGKVGVKVATPQGDSAMLIVLGPGDVFGELALLASRSLRTATVVALEPCETLTLRRESFEQLRRDHPSIDHFLNEVLAAHVERLNHLLLDALFTPSDTRVLRRLVDLVQVYGGSGEATTIPLTQDDLASLSGTSRPTVNRVLRCMEEAGALALRRGRIDVLEPETLRRRAH